MDPNIRNPDLGDPVHRLLVQHTERLGHAVDELATAAREREQVRNDIATRFPHVHDLIEIRDRIAESRAEHADRMKSDALVRSSELLISVHREVRDVFAALEAELDNCLARLGIELMRVEPVFDPTLHRAAGGIGSHDPGLIGRVAEVKTPGFIWLDADGRERVLRPALVTVYISAEERRNADE